MRSIRRRKGAMVITIAGALLAALWIALEMRRDESGGAWEAEVEGFLAVATPCCDRASLWKSLDQVTADGQRARPATSAEAAEWLDTWPYRSREQADSFEQPELSIAAQSTEVRCMGPATGAPVPRRGDDVENLEAMRTRRECTLAKWKVWSGDTAAQRPNERHTVWVDEQDRFRGRVDYWR